MSALKSAMPIAPKFWASGPSVQVARQGPPTSSRAWGKVLATQAVLAPMVEMDEELVRWLQEEEVVVEEVWLGRDTATLEVVMEAAGPLICSQLGGLGALTE